MKLVVRILYSLVSNKVLNNSSSLHIHHIRNNQNINSPSSLRSLELAPTHNPTRPRSSPALTQFCVITSHTLTSLLSKLIVTDLLSLASRYTLSKPLKTRWGLSLPKLRYNCTTSWPALSPVFCTVRETLYTGCQRSGLPPGAPPAGWIGCGLDDVALIGSHFWLGWP